MKFSLTFFLVIAFGALRVLAVPQTFLNITGDNTTIVNAVAICGKLGVMKVEDHILPIGASKKDVRMCAEHPHGRNRTVDPNEGTSLAPFAAAAAVVVDNKEQSSGRHPDTTSPVPSSAGLEKITTLVERKCYDAAPYGCSRKYCWRSCGNSRNPGKWCWTADNLGLGDWQECETWRDCSGDASEACGVCLNLVVCGCSC